MLAMLTLLGVAGFFGVRHLRASYHYRAARESLEERAFDQALSHARACLELRPGNAAAHLLAARAARGAGQPGLAGEHLEACRRLGGRADRIVLERYLLRAQQGDLAEVEKKLLALVRRHDPDTPLILEVVTERWLREYRFEEAGPLLALWRELRPDDPEPIIRQAGLDANLFRVNEAIDGYRQALEQAPDRDCRENDRVRLCLAELLLRNNQAGPALDHYRVLREHQPQNLSVALGLARCHRTLGQTKEAETLLDGLLATGTPSGQVLGERGQLALEAEQMARAEAWLRQAATLCPFDREIVHNLHTCLRKAGRKDAARWAERLAQIRADEKRMGKLMKEVMQSPDDAGLRQQIGVVFLRNGMREEGRRWLLSALSRDPGHVASHQALARDYEAAGELDHAARHLRALQQLGVTDKTPVPDKEQP